MICAHCPEKIDFTEGEGWFHSQVGPDRGHPATPTGYCCDPDNPMDCEDRANCDKVGTLGHMSCGRCAAHGKPRHAGHMSCDLVDNPAAHISLRSKIVQVCSNCGSEAEHHVQFVRDTGKCVI